MSKPKPFGNPPPDMRDADKWQKTKYAYVDVYPGTVLKFGKDKKCKIEITKAKKRSETVYGAHVGDPAATGGAMYLFCISKNTLSLT